MLIGGLDYANDLTGWLAHEPADPLDREAADFHNYQGKACDNPACWNSQVAPVAARVPVVTGEFDEEVCSPDGFDDAYLSWADSHGVGYLAWGGTAAAPNGTSLRSHLLASNGSGAAGKARKGVGLRG